MISTRLSEIRYPQLLTIAAEWDKTWESIFALKDLIWLECEQNDLVKTPYIQKLETRLEGLERKANLILEGLKLDGFGISDNIKTALHASVIPTIFVW